MEEKCINIKSKMNIFFLKKYKYIWIVNWTHTHAGIILYSQMFDELLARNTLPFLLYKNCYTCDPNTPWFLKDL